MTDKNKEPMIGQENRPSAIDFDTPVSQLKLRDLVNAVQGTIIEEKFKPEKELIKGERIKELISKEQFKPEKEFFKPEKEFFKPEKELLKGDVIKEFAAKPPELKPEKEIGDIIDEPTIDRIAARVAERLGRGGGG
jgi:hypothetical protein